MTLIGNPAPTELGFTLGPGGRAVAYCDGHVKWVRGQKFWNDASLKTTGAYANYPQNPNMRVGNPQRRAT